MAAGDGHVVEEDRVGGIATDGDLGLIQLKDIAGLRPLDDGKDRDDEGRALHEVRRGGIAARHAKNACCLILLDIGHGNPLAAKRDKPGKYNQ